jgi:hypothetical protein
MGIWLGVAMDCLKFYMGPPCPTALRPAEVAQPQGGVAYGLWPSSTPLDTPPPNACAGNHSLSVLRPIVLRPAGVAQLQGGVAYGRLLPLWTPHARTCVQVTIPCRTDVAGFRLD